MRQGAQLGPTINSADRAAHPLYRTNRRAEFVQTDWDTALERIASKFQQLIGRYGPDSVAFYGSGQLDSESAYTICKLFKGFIGTNNTDSNSRLCMAAAVAGYRSSLGSDAPPTCYEDIEFADVVLLIGSNMAEAHPVTFDRLRAAKKNRPEMQIVVVDPRLTATAAIADLHIPVRAGGDIALLNAIARILVDAGMIDEHFIAQHTRGYEEFLGYLITQDLGESLSPCRRGTIRGFQVSPAHRQRESVLEFLLHGDESKHRRDVEE